MQTWANYLDRLRAGEIEPGPRTTSSVQSNADHSGLDVQKNIASPSRVRKIAPLQNRSIEVVTIADTLNDIEKLQDVIADTVKLHRGLSDNQFIHDLMNFTTIYYFSMLSHATLDKPENPHPAGTGPVRSEVLLTVRAGGHAERVASDREHLRDVCSVEHL